ncbi:Oidioi.mRNA.OKI2018_I69.XSR.g16124.t1.cds [Oikopleura dioica]|uniref:Oidioi.mRNA.OKI2018_I69.XSR.g16124.t1.cds n=1 Tax=Oikopleura dioica TaxID=34765 RepID=A0ABN7SJB8_OIKDI|nr:Oidioi.mRNA.OKI2018_I69.XSR.g16124.t1.cds [Oikopleura dioica]
MSKKPSKVDEAVEAVGSPLEVARVGLAPSYFTTRRTRTLSATARIDAADLETGTVAAFSRTKGHGFLNSEDGKQEFFHVSDVVSQIIPKEGDLVKYRVIPIPPKFEKCQAVQKSVEMDLNGEIDWHDFLDGSDFEEDEEEEQEEDGLFSDFLKQEVDNPLYERNKELMEVNAEVIQANIELRKKVRALTDEKTALMAEMLDMRCEVALKMEQYEASRTQNVTLESNSSSALGDSFINETNSRPGSRGDNSRPNSAEPEFVGSKMKLPGRRTTAFNLDFDETAEFKSPEEPVQQGTKMKLPGRRTTRFKLDLDETNEENESPVVQKPLPERIKRPSRSKATRKSKYRQTMLTVEEDREVETSKLPSPDMGLLKIGKTATFAFEYDETIDGSPIRSPRSTKNSPKIKSPGSLCKSPLASPLSEKEETTPGRRRRFEKPEIQGAKMKIPGRRTTTFGFDFDESNESLKEEEAVASPSVLLRHRRSQPAQEKQNGRKSQKRRKSSSKRGSLSKPGGIFGNISATTETISVPDLSLQETAAYEGVSKDRHEESNENAATEISATKKKGRPKKNAQPVTPLKEQNGPEPLVNISERVSRRARKVVSYKEPSTGSKLRRGDANTDSSLYSSWSPKNSTKNSAKKKPKKRV